MIRILSVVALALIFSMQAHASINLVCGSKSQGVGYFTLKSTRGAIVATAHDESCRMKTIPYNPRSGKYEGWGRVAPSDSCEAFAKAIGLTGDVTFLSLSAEALQGDEGFAQIGYVNTFDPGAGGELKNDLRCFVPKD